MAKPKPLLNDDFMGTLTNEGKKLTEDVKNALEPIIKKWINKGYGMRDIHNIVMFQAQGSCVFTAAFYQMEKKR